MTAIVGVLNSQGIAVAADSAVTVTGKNGKKVYNRSNKIFTLSKYHPVGIAIYSNADFLGIPLETLIKLYRAELKEDSFPTLSEYKLDFLEFIKTKVGHISREYKENAFYGFCNETYNTIKDKVIENLDQKIQQLAQMLEAEAIAQMDNEVLAEIDAHLVTINGLAHAAYVNIPLEDFALYYQNELTNIANFIQGEIQKKHPLVTLKANHLSRLTDLFFSLVNIELIFESLCGLVFVGFGEDELYPSSQQVFLGTLIADQVRVRFMDPIQIIPGKLDSNILPYVQGDVTTAVLTGVDPNYKKEASKAITTAFNSIAAEVSLLIPDHAQAQQITQAITTSAQQLILELDDYQFKTLTGPLLEILAHMGKEDMSELAESLVNITSLRRKFTSSDSSDESVGGPVDVAIITKGDGFVWMKRKQYFDINDNQGFITKYYKI